MRMTLFIIINLLLITSIYAKDIGIAWEGKASMQDEILRGFLTKIKTYDEKLNIEIKKELESIDEVKKLALKWDKEKDAMILLRSSSAKMLSYTKTNIPTFIGGCNHPVALGTMSNFLSPQKNITGVTYYLNKKTTIRMIKLFVPNIKSILFIGEKGHYSTPIEQNETKNIITNDYNIKYSEYISDDIENIIQEVKNKKDKFSAIILGNQALISNNADQIVIGAGNTPVFSYGKSSITNGALAGYVADDYKLGMKLADSVYSVLFKNKLIKEVPVKIDNYPEFYINKKTLDNLNMKIPSRLKDKAILIR